MNAYVEKVYNGLVERNGHEKEFLQAVREVLEALSPVFDKHPEYENKGLLERFVEPDRAILFRVPWVDDNGKVQVNRGYRVQYNNAIGPYKGGLRLALSRCSRTASPACPSAAARAAAILTPRARATTK